MQIISVINEFSYFPHSLPEISKMSFRKSMNAVILHYIVFFLESETYLPRVWGSGYVKIGLLLAFLIFHNSKLFHTSRAEFSIAGDIYGCV